MSCGRMRSKRRPNPVDAARLKEAPFTPRGALDGKYPRIEKGKPRNHSDKHLGTVRRWIIMATRTSALTWPVFYGLPATSDRFFIEYSVNITRTCN